VTGADLLDQSMMRAAQIDAALSGCSLFTLLDRMVAHATLRPMSKKAVPPKPPSRSVGRYVPQLLEHMGAAYAPLSAYEASLSRDRRMEAMGIPLSRHLEALQQGLSNGAWTGEMRGVSQAFSTQASSSVFPDFSQCSTQIQPMRDRITSSGVYD
jgi:hypothetical protein